MDRFGLIGFPVDHSISPKLFEAAYGGTLDYDLLGGPDFEQIWRSFIQGPYKAVNVTAPFKEAAFRKADIPSPESLGIGAANILVKTPQGIRAFNSDYLAVRSLLGKSGDIRTVAVAGFGGAGKAALKAARDSGFDTQLFRHDSMADGIEADMVIYTLTGAVPGTERIRCRHLLEANYRNPVLSSHPGYISGKIWLLEQALLGYPLMTGLEPSLEAMRAIIEK